MKNHIMLKSWYFKKYKIHLDLTNWFSIRTFGWKLNGYPQKVVGLQIGWLQGSILVNIRKAEK